MSAHHCSECFKEGATMHCGKCGMVFYCSRECQTRNWKRIHKRVCTEDASLRPFIPVEMAIERAVKRQPKVQAPKDATCYICLEGEDEVSSKLMRGCACRGDSAGFVHLECLTKLAVSKEASRGDPLAIIDAWSKCGNCKEHLEWALGLEMRRRFWQRHRSSQDPTFRFNSMTYLANTLAHNGEFGSSNQLYDEAYTCIGNYDKAPLLQAKIHRARTMWRHGQPLEGVELLKTILTEAKEHTATELYFEAMKGLNVMLLDLGRNQEAYATAADLVTFTKAKYGPENTYTLSAREAYADTCARIGRVEEAKTNFKDVLTIETRVFGRDHTRTQCTMQQMKHVGLAVPAGLLLKKRQN